MTGTKKKEKVTKAATTKAATGERKERKLRKKNPMSDTSTRLARYRNLAQENLQRQKVEAAQRCLEKAVYIAVKTYGPQHLEVGTNLLELGSVLYQRGHVEVAEPLMARAHRILQAMAPSV